MTNKTYPPVTFTITERPDLPAVNRWQIAVSAEGKGVILRGAGSTPVEAVYEALKRMSPEWRRHIRERDL